MGEALGIQVVPLSFPWAMPGPHMILLFLWRQNPGPYAYQASTLLLGYTFYPTICLCVCVL